MSNSPCHYVEDRGYLLRAHMPYCKDTECKGCVPCTHDNYGNPIRHCTARAHCSNHLDSNQRLTCAECVSRTTGHIEEILQWSDEVYDEALEAGVDSEAANLAGPAADPIRALWARVNHNHGAAVEERAWESEDRHPLTVLGGYEMRLREDYDEDYSELPPITIGGAASYLLARLNRIAQDETQDWPYLTSEIASCHAHLSEVLHLARRPEKGAPCPACDKAPALVKRYVEYDHTGASDFWRCPSCGATWTEALYRQRVGDDYLDNADALTSTDLVQRTGVPAGTIRRWASAAGDEPPRLRSCGRGHDGRKLYRVADVLNLREGEDTRRAS